MYKFWVGLVAVVGVLATGCATEVQGVDAAETDRAVYTEAFERWMGVGFGMSEHSSCFDSGELIIPLEVVAIGQEFTRLCNGAIARESDGTCAAADGCAASCQTYVPGTREPLIVIAPQHANDAFNLRRLRGHEYYHWIAECSGVATDWANEHHAVPGVWEPVTRGDDYLMRVFDNDYDAKRHADPAL